MSADPVAPSTTHLALEELSFCLKGHNIEIKIDEPGCRIQFNQTGSTYYGVIVGLVSSKTFTVAPPDHDWAQVSGGSVNRGWHEFDGLCKVRKETIVAVIDDSNMMEIRFNDPVTDDSTDDEDIEASNEETKTPNEVESSSSSVNGTHPSDDDDDDDDDDDESVVGVPPVQSTSQPNSASTPPPTMPERRKSNRKTTPLDYNRYNSRGNDDQ